ncbi:MAG: hypothetical protein ACE5D7_07030 [Fidelibacterota bacterium]
MVGKIETDSGQFNAARWDGNEWELIQIERLVDFDCVFGFDNNDIWFSDGCYIYLYNGSEFIKKWECDWETYGTGQVNRIWGASSANIFFVGNNGSIIHHNGSTFTRVESSTNVDLTDVWGCSDNEIWAAGREYNKSVILRYNGSSWVTFYEWDSSLDEYIIPQEELLLSISSIWTTPYMDSLIAVGAWGVFTVSKQTGKARWSYQRRWDWDPSTIGYPLRVRGRAANDVFVSGKRGTILHFNGKNWKHYYDFYEPGGIWLRGIGLSNRTAYFAGANLVIKAIKQ